MSDQGAEDVGYRVLICSVANCGARFSLRERLSEHYQVAHSRFLCEYDDCLQHYATRLIAKDHFVVHTNARHSSLSGGSSMWNPTFGGTPSSSVGGSFFSDPPSRLLTPSVTKLVGSSFGPFPSPDTSVGGSVKSTSRSKGVQCALLTENLRVMYNRGTQVSKYCCCVLVYLVLCFCVFLYM